VKGVEMAELVFAMELKGNAVPVEGKEGTFRAQTSGRDPSGERVTFESEVVLEGEGFNETGSIDYSGRGKVRFQTKGIGYIEPSPVSDWQCGAVIWRITEGEGEFRGASGYITSNFTFSANGEVVDNQYVRIYTP
jgi:hypothetical protein